MIQLASPWDRPQHPARALLLFRGVYALLAFDAWTLMLEHGGRYGVGGFNVAHFDLIDWLLPLPSAALYLGIVTATGLLAFQGAFGLLSRFEACWLWLLYTSAWMLSMHDSYQHHYLLSWWLAFGILTPVLRADACLRSAARIREYSVPLIMSCCAIVYFFTAVSKSSPLWRSGAVLRKLAADGGPIAWGPEILQRLGVGAADAWHFAALGIVLVQLVIAAGFLAALYRDAHEGRALGMLASLALVTAGSFHLATELSPSFAIGWFSYYMLWAGAVLLSPASWLARLFGLALRAAPRLPLPELSRGRLFVLTLLSALGALLLLARETLPGVGLAAVFYVTLVSSRIWLERSGGRLQESARLAWLPALALVAFCLTVASAHVRFDYYRRCAGELLRMGRTGEALELYRKAEQHAPRGQSRRAKIEQLERRLSDPSDE